MLGLLFLLAVLLGLARLLVPGLPLWLLLFLPLGPAFPWLKLPLLVLSAAALLAVGTW